MTAVISTAGGKEIIQSFLDQYGLGSLGNWAWITYIGNGGGQTGMDAITAELPTTPEFKARFPAYDQLRKEGRAMSINDMLSYEQTARQIFHNAGLPAGFYDKPDDFAKFMLNDVSTNELQTRVTLAQQAVVDAPADVRTQLHTLYGIDSGHLTAHFLDPNEAYPLLQKQYTSSVLGAQSVRAGVGQLTEAQAMGLAQFGVTEAQGQQGFQQLGTDVGLYQQQVQGEHAVGLDQQLGAQFEGNVQAQVEFQRRRQQRLAAFQQQTGFGLTNTGVGGLGPAQRGV